MDNRIRDLRTACGWTQADLAHRLNVSRQTVISLERGRYDPSLPLAFAIARLFDRPIEDVFHDGVGPPGWDRALPRPGATQAASPPDPTGV
jgi:putative transcriptional regulator